MSSEPVRPLRRERRAAALAYRRTGSQRTSGAPQRIGIGVVSVISLAAGLVLVAAILVFGGQSKPVSASVARAVAPAGIPTSGRVLGNATAAVTIDLYEDFQCPACEQWGQNVFPSLVRNEVTAGTVKIVFHGFAFIGPESNDASRAAWAAERQGHFWDMWATLYANQGLHENGGAFARARLLAMADVLGLDSVRFVADLDSAAATTFVTDGLADAARAGVNSTPTLIIDGKTLRGAGYADVAAAVAAVAP